MRHSCGSQETLAITCRTLLVRASMPFLSWESGMQPPRRAILVAFLDCRNHLQSRVVARQCADSPPYDINPIVLYRKRLLRIIEDEYTSK